MRLTGRLLQIEPYAGDFVGEDGSKIAYAGTRLHILDGVEVVKVKQNHKTPPLPEGIEAGDTVDLRVQVTANSGARGAYLSTVFDGLWSDSPALVSTY
jgi:hypothetical protein